MSAPQALASASGAPDRGRARRRAAILVLAASAGLLAASAWLSDDAFITFRTLDNLRHGLGLTWNPAERVQSYTHPLWLLLNAAADALTGEILLTSMALAGALTLAALALIVFRLAPDVAAGVVAVAALLSSKAFLDYSSSGLEDPLTRLLAVLFVLELVRARGASRMPRIGRLVLWSALAALSRPDALLLFLPALARRLLVAWRESRGGAAVLAAIAGGAPLLLWAAFATFYYGSPLPNTAFAKLGTGLPRGIVVAQGLRYLLDSLVHDPWTFVVLVAGTAVGWRRFRSEPGSPGSLLRIGAWLYVGYAVWIGGDFMSGRLLGAPLLLMVLAAVVEPLPRFDRRVATSCLTALVASLVVRAIVPMVEDPMARTGIADEHRFYSLNTGLWAALVGSRWPDHPWRDEGEAARRQGIRVLVRGSVGMLGYYAGPTVHIVDEHGLTDPLLSRLPAMAQDRLRRPGHYRRSVPAGYLESVASDADRIEDPDLARYYEVLRVLTRGPLLGPGRLRTLLRFQLGAYDGWRRAYLQRLR